MSCQDIPWQIPQRTQARAAATEARTRYKQSHTFFQTRTTHPSWKQAREAPVSSNNTMQVNQPNHTRRLLKQHVQAGPAHPEVPTSRAEQSRAEQGRVGQSRAE